MSDDRYAWLEDVEGDRPLEWVRWRNALAEESLAASPRFREIEEQTLEVQYLEGLLLDLPEPGRCGERLLRQRVAPPHPLERAVTFDVFKPGIAVIGHGPIPSRKRGTGAPSVGVGRRFARAARARCGLFVAYLLVNGCDTLVDLLAVLAAGLLVGEVGALRKDVVTDLFSLLAVPGLKTSKVTLSLIHISE